MIMKINDKRLLMIKLIFRIGFWKKLKSLKVKIYWWIRLLKESIRWIKNILNKNNKNMWCNNWMNLLIFKSKFKSILWIHWRLMEYLTIILWKWCVLKFLSCTRVEILIFKLPEKKGKNMWKFILMLRKF